MSFKDLSIEMRYRSEEHDFPRDFLIPVLKETACYKRAVGFFSSSALIDLSVGLFEMAKNGGHIQLIASPHLSDEDIEAIRLGYKTREKVMIEALECSITEPINEFEAERLNLVATLIASGMLEMKRAFVEKGTYKNLYHEKIAVFQDKDGNMISFTGSANESSTAFYDNFESIYVFCDWKDGTHKEFAEIADRDFNEMWDNHTQKIVVIPFPDVVAKKLDQYRKDTVDYQTDEKEFHYDEFIEREKPFRKPKNVILRDYQKTAVSNWIANGYRGIFDMCTGSGKSYTALACMVDVAQRENYKVAVFIVCPFIHLVGQWEEDVIEWCPPPIIAHSQSSDQNWKETLKKAYIRFKRNGTPFVCITTNDTFAGDYIPKIIEGFDETQKVILVVDEAHNFGAERLLNSLPQGINYRIALSATIERYGDPEGTKSLESYFGEKCITYGIEDAIRDNALTKYNYYPVPVYLDSDELDQYNELTRQIGKCIVSDNGKKKLSKQGEMLAFKRSRLLAGARGKIPLLVQKMRQFKDDTHILVYCGATEVDSISGGSKRMIDEVTDVLQSELNLKVHRFTADETLKERQDVKYFFTEGMYQVITAIKCLDEGVNIPAIKTAFILASTRNPREFIQRRGRLLRKFENKEFAEIYDFITLPRDLRDVVYGDYEKDKSIVSGELLRIYEFGRYASNKSTADSMIMDIMNAYEVFYDIDTKESEEWYDG